MSKRTRIRTETALILLAILVSAVALCLTLAEIAARTFTDLGEYTAAYTSIVGLLAYAFTSMIVTTKRRPVRSARGKIR